MPVVVPGLETLFAPDADEDVVLSVCAARDGDGDGWELIHGTLLVVPDTCASVSWARWDNENGGGIGEPSVELPPDTVVQGDGWLLGRTSMDLKTGSAWLRALVEQMQNPNSNHADVALPAAGPIPSLGAQLRRPKAMIRVMPGAAAPTSCLLTGLGRPARALHFDGSAERRMPEVRSAETPWGTTYLATRDISGIHITPEGLPPTAGGLLVGRAERGAWIRKVRGDGRFEHFLVDIGWDPGRIDLGDLVVSHEEFLGDELALATHLHLDDLDLDGVHDAGACTVSTPTLGRGVQHAVELHHVDDGLLDRTARAPIAEAVQISMSIVGSEHAPIVSRTETDVPVPDLDGRLAAADQIAADLGAVMSSGAQARLIADERLGTQRLTSRLRRVRGELLIMDPFFGQHADEWRLLDDVPVPVRVLTRKLPSDRAPELGANVQARHRAKAKIHDRVYIWDGGGFTLGGSLSTLAQGVPVRIGALRRADADAWRVRFEQEWASPLYSDLMDAWAAKQHLSDAGARGGD